MNGLRRKQGMLWAMVFAFGLRPVAGVSQSVTGASVLAKSSWIAAEPDGPARLGVLPVTTSAGPALPLFRRGFTVAAKPVSAVLSISGLGQFEAHINGKNVTSAVLTPGWSDYRKRVYFDSYDVTALVVAGENAIGVLLGNGMYDVESPANRYTKFRGTFGQPKMIAELRMTFAGGRTETVVSDATWTTAPGPITFTNIYGGEDFDARLEPAGWDRAGFAAGGGWGAVRVVGGPGGQMVRETIPPVIANETYAPVAVTHPKPGVDVYDLGQNFAGWFELEASGAAGDALRILPGELLDAGGMVTQRSMNATAKAPDSFSFTLRGGGAEAWHPRFSYTSFRYVQVEAVPATADGAAPVVSKMVGRFLHDDVKVDGSFTSSSTLLNRIHTLIDRAVLSNMVSVLTDCPSREKLGWIEQTHLAAASMMFNFGMAPLYAKQAADMRDDQTAEGMVPDHVPEMSIFGGDFRDTPEWGAAVILSPWAAYQFYGDKEQLRLQYPAMRRYAAFLRGKAKDHLLLYGLGDWYDIGPKGPGRSQLTGAGVTATGIYYQALTAMVRIAPLVGHPEDAAEYGAEAALVKAAYNGRFYHAEKAQYDTGSQTANAMPLAVGLVEEQNRAAVLESLVADIRSHGDHLTSGEIGFHYVVRALTDAGRSDVVYAMVSRTDKPSYGDQLARGATTLTEAWDANPAESQNHFMLGHAEEWFYRGLAGIDFDLSRAERERIRIAPAVLGDLTSAAATYKSVLGEVRSSWVLAGDELTWTVVVPVGAMVKFPAGFSGAAGLKDGYVGGGVHVFRLRRG